LDDGKVDAFMVMVEHIRKIYNEGEVEDTNRKGRHLGKDLDLNILPNFKHEMQREDDMMYVAPS
jgi:hypothetical protein